MLCIVVRRHTAGQDAHTHVCLQKGWGQRWGPYGCQLRGQAGDARATLLLMHAASVYAAF
jgi:hypothetical protein